MGSMVHISLHARDKHRDQNTSAGPVHTVNVYSYRQLPVLALDM